MPEKETLKRAQRDKQEGKSPSTQAGEFVREEMHHIREGKHGARSTEQAIAIGLSKARRAGVKLPAQGKSSSGGKKKAIRAAARPAPKRSRGVREALKHEPHRAASTRALAKHAHDVARRRGPAARSAAARKAAKTRKRTSSRGGNPSQSRSRRNRGHGR